MNVQEIMKLLYLEKRLFPREKSLNVPPSELTQIAKAQAQLLQDIPFEVGKAAVAAHAAGCAFAPAISEIRAYAKKLTEPPRLTADEAWAKARYTMTRYGAAPYKSFTTGKYPFEMARENTDPEVWRVMELMGYTGMCRSENPEAVRAQFIAAWERQQRVQEERENLLPFLPEALKEKFLAIGAGQGAAG